MFIVCFFQVGSWLSPPGGLHLAGQRRHDAPGAGQPCGRCGLPEIGVPHLHRLWLRVSEGFYGSEYL